MFILKPYAIDLIYPNMYNKLKDYTLLIGAQKDGLYEFDNNIIKMCDNQFIDTCDEYGVAQYEHLTRIHSSEDDSLQVRRERVKFRWNLGPVFTEEWLFKYLDTVFKQGSWRYIKDYSNFKFYIELDTNEVFWYEELVIALNTTKPCNMVYEIIVLPLTLQPKTAQIGYVHTVINSEVPWLG